MNLQTKLEMQFPQPGLRHPEPADANHACMHGIMLRAYYKTNFDIMCIQALERFRQTLTSRELEAPSVESSFQCPAVGVVERVSQVQYSPWHQVARKFTKTFQAPRQPLHGCLYYALGLYGHRVQGPGFIGMMRARQACS